MLESFLPFSDATKSFERVMISEPAYDNLTIIHFFRKSNKIMSL